MSASERATVRIVNKEGLHARPMSLFVKKASSFDAEIVVTGPEGTVADGLSVFSMMSLEASQGSEITIEASGSQAKEALDALVVLIRGGFVED